MKNNIIQAQLQLSLHKKTLIRYPYYFKMSIYILYRKTNIGDGDHEPTDRLIASSNIKNIFTEKNYNLLFEYEHEYKQVLEQDDDDDDTFFYFIITIKLDEINANGEDDGYLFWDATRRSDDIFQGTLQQFKNVVDTGLFPKNKYKDAFHIPDNLADLLGKKRGSKLTLNKIIKEIGCFLDKNTLLDKKEYNKTHNIDIDAELHLKEILNIPRNEKLNNMSRIEKYLLKMPFFNENNIICKAANKIC